MSNGSDMGKEYCSGDFRNAIRSLTPKASGVDYGRKFCFHR